MKFTASLLLTALLGIAACKKEEKTPPAQIEITTTHNLREADKPFVGKWYQKKVLDTMYTQFEDTTLIVTTHLYNSFTSQDYVELKGLDYAGTAPAPDPKQCVQSSQHGLNHSFWSYDASSRTLRIAAVPKAVLSIHPSELVLREAWQSGKVYTVQYTWYERSE